MLSILKLEDAVRLLNSLIEEYKENNFRNYERCEYLKKLIETQLEIVNKQYIKVKKDLREMFL